MSRRFFIPALILVAASLAPLADTLWAQAVAQETQQAQQAAPGFWSLVFSKGGLVTWVIALLSAVGVPIAAIKLYGAVEQLKVCSPVPPVPQVSIWVPSPILNLRDFSLITVAAAVISGS